MPFPWRSHIKFLIRTAIEVIERYETLELYFTIAVGLAKRFQVEFMMP